jgi:hypothetical protein
MPNQPASRHRGRRAGELAAVTPTPRSREGGARRRERATMVFAASCMDLQRGSSPPGRVSSPCPDFLRELAHGERTHACCRGHAAAGRLPGLGKSGRGGTMERKMGWIGGALERGVPMCVFGNLPPRRERPVAHKLNIAIAMLIC